MITLIYSCEPTLISYLIRLRYWSDWSHVGIVDGDHVIEAVPGIGVRRVSVQQSLANCDRWQRVDYPCANPAAVINAAKTQLGKPYDLKGALGIGLNHDWQDDAAWWCSEFVPWTMAQAGEPWFRPEAIHRIAPEHLWMRAAL